MKKTTMGLLAAVVILASCQKSNAPQEEIAETETTAAIGQRCASTELFEQQVASDPVFLQRRQQIETYTQTVLKNKSNYRLLADGTVEIPVVVHVIYNTTVQNISDAQVQSQIDVLNEDFTKTNADNTNVPAAFATSTGNPGVRFILDSIIRLKSAKKSWSLNDDMKLASRGGSNVVDPTTYLNLWVVNKISYQGRGILGYAQFPGGARATDGVVIAYNYFGRTGSVSAPYHLGRTGTHEVGHWLNLNHIWGDDGGSCSGTDNVGDTPNQAGENYGKPAFPKVDACSPASPGVMFMNYMDYTDDAAMYMFTHGQRDRMRAQFVSGAYRAAMGTL